MSQFSTQYFYEMLLSLPGILIAITFHEMAHGYAADAMGDPTPKNAGRLTLNPLKHLDPIGFIAMIFLHFGWAKPVPINPNNFKDRKKGMISVALAGCLTNLLLGFIGMGAYYAVMPLNNDALQIILQYIFTYNILFAVFNILPIPPLDGSQVLAVCLPPKGQAAYQNFSRYGMFVLLILMFTGVFSLIISPPVNGLITLFSNIWSAVFGLFW